MRENVMELRVFFLVFILFLPGAVLSGDLKIYETQSSGKSRVYMIDAGILDVSPRGFDNAFDVFVANKDVYKDSALDYFGSDYEVYEIRLKQAMTRDAYDFWFVVVSAVVTKRSFSADRLSHIVMTMSGDIIDPIMGKN
ncbi:MAG: hypothetical protein ACK4SX_13265 [Alcanivoracaceae bacterium]